MKYPILATLLLLAAPALAQTTPGGQFLQAWDLDGNGTATLAELQQMRGNVFTTFDANEDGILDATEYVAFDEARAADVSNYDGLQQAQMQKVADGMTLSHSDRNGDGHVDRAEFVAGAQDWFAALDRNSDGGITSADFQMK